MSVLFPLQVDSFQPAFVYNKDNNSGSVSIYYSLSDYNTIDSSAKYSIEVSIVDPNMSSGWGSDSIGVIENDNIDLSIGKIEINCSELKELNYNQFYQAQLTLIKNGTERSLPSQPTLIRPISKPTFSIEQAGKTLAEFNRVNGVVTYADESQVEAIKSYIVKVKSGDNIVYKSKNIINLLGTQFATYLYDCELSDGNYILEIDFTTVNGYQDSISVDFAIGTSGENPGKIFGIGNFEIANIKNIGAVEIQFHFDSEPFDTQILAKKYNIEIQRSSEEEFYKTWKSIKNIVITKDSQDWAEMGFRYVDRTINSQVFYRYRIIIIPIGENSDTIAIYDKYKIKDKETGGEVIKNIEIFSDFEDIFLLGEKCQMSVKYNPNISGVKYVTQESITNTLGGKFPIVRVNGDTKYLQFNLSGTLYFNYNFGNDVKDSTNKDISYCFKNEEDTLLFDTATIEENFSKIAVGEDGPSLEMKKRIKRYIERKYRELAKEFLTNQQAKLLRGPAEKTMIVYLSNISFTPNKSLDREIVDFSCTVTEIAEFNNENLKKFNILTLDSYKSLFYYFNVISGEGGYYIPSSEFIDGIPILHSDWEIIEI